ncbi:MAG: cytochrome P450 [Deltaproteobacteria bacterium]|nr:MAG: cytochrome P450 [Deltaproteobacteria bacterium]
MSDPFLEMIGAEDPYPTLHALRASDPVHFVEPLGFWLATRHDDVKRLYHDPENVTLDKRIWERHVPMPEGTMFRWAEDHGSFAAPREEHARIRRLVSAAFTPRAVRRMEDQIREVIEGAAAPLRGRYGEVIDLQSEFTNVVPNTVISRITGVPPGDDEVRFRKLAQSVIAGFMPFTPEEVRREAERDFQDLSVWVREMVAKRRAHPEEDLVTDLVHAQDADDRLCEDDIVSLLSGLIGAGSETTALGGASILRMLLDEPHALTRLRSDRALIRRSIDEIIRYTIGGPAGTLRYAIRDFELRGKRIRRGQMIMLSIGGANRDPAVFENPDVLDLDRAVRDLPTFGNGPHYCLGANLARQEMACMLDTLLDVVPPGSRVRSDQVGYRDVGLFRRATNLPVRIGPRPSADAH